MPFLDVKTDFAFKKVFGSEELKDIFSRSQVLLGNAGLPSSA